MICPKKKIPVQHTVREGGGEGGGRSILNDSHKATRGKKKKTPYWMSFPGLSSGKKK